MEHNSDQSAHRQSPPVAKTSDIPEELQSAREAPYSTFVPLLLFGLVVVLFIAFQVSVLTRERIRLEQAHEQQEETVLKAREVRAQLDSIADKTARLADGGNANAKRLVDLLQARGVTIKPRSDAGPE